MKKDESLEKIAEWIKSQIPLKLPENIKLRRELHKEDNVLFGHTKLSKLQNQIKVIITLHISNNLLERKGIREGIKIILVHEFCHVVNPFHPDEVMKIYFPQIWIVWQKCKEKKGLECDAKITRFQKNDIFIHDQDIRSIE